MTGDKNPASEAAAAMARARWAKVSEADRSEQMGKIARDYSAKLTPEQRIARAKKASKAAKRARKLRKKAASE